MYRILAVLLLLASMMPLDSAAQLRLSRVFADGMVMQRNADVPVWGWASPGQEVTVTFDGANYAAEADAQGRWSVALPAMPAGGPHALAVEAGGQRLQADDILVGDVWVASGQSNMEWPVDQSLNAEEEIAAATDPAIRHFYVPHSWAPRPEDELPEGSNWQVASPATVGSFSAVGYFFARELRKHVDVPIGLLHASWGGSRIEPWMSAEALGLDADAYTRIMAEEREREERLRTRLRETIGRELPAEDPGMIDGVAVWADPSLDESDWGTIEVPRRWEEVGYEGLDGIAWYRASFDLAEEEAAQGVTLGLGMIDDSDVAWVNGHEVGRMQMAWNKARIYDVPADALTPGENVIAVRVEDTGGGGGITGSSEHLYVDVAGERRPLPSTWKFAIGRAEVNLDSQKNQVATLLYNKMIHPLLNFPIAGALWYQGESNAYPQQAHTYRTQFKSMINDWRSRWATTTDPENASPSPSPSASFPFLWVQLANYMSPDAEPTDSDWAMLRESQSAALALPNTGQAVAIDIGEADDIHPRNKQEVGRRLALAARKIAYGHDIVHSGPVYTGHTVRDGRIVLAFDHVGSGLRARGGDLSGFAIAGEDGKFVWAEAEIEGDYIVVWSDAVERPVAVRYAWGNNPEGANLYNADGLPALPFRTDDW